MTRNVTQPEIEGSCLKMSDPLLLSRRSACAAMLAASAFPLGATARKPRILYADGLSFLPEDMRDIPASGIGAMICDISEVEEVRDPDGTPRYRRTFATSDKAIDAAHNRLKGDGRAYIALKGSEIGTRRGCATFLQFQSSEMIGTDLARIAHFHGKGLRVWQLTHHNDEKFAGGAIMPVQSGLTPLGREGIAEFNRLKILTDVSHGSEATIMDAARASTAPIIYSHGMCKALLNHPRGITDEGIKAIASRGGVVGMFMMSFWLTRDAVPKPEHYLAHLRHAINIGGEDCVAVANDFPFRGQLNLLKLRNDNAKGVKEYHEWWKAMHALGIPGFDTLPEHVVIPHFNHIKRMERIHRTLDRAGFPARQIEKIMGGNVKRILTDVLG